MTIPTKVTILEHEQWEAVYFDDRLVHWNDALSGRRMLRLLGIDYDLLRLDPAKVDPESLPDSLAEYRSAVADATRLAKLAEREQVRRRLRELDAELGVGVNANVNAKG